ncbi:MAG: ABC-type cobalt transporter, permease CbiQ [Micrococcaceae bacterium]|nr:ABC-type cobalt transporter, permease CbiQ [Micrococcaceae bacterium]
MSIDLLAPARTASVLSRANPLSKLASALLLTLALLLTVDWVSASVALACELLLLPLAGIGGGLLLRRGWPVLIAAVVGGYGSALLAPKTGAALLNWGPFLFTTGSLEAGVAIVLRGVAIALPGILLLACTDPTDLADALAQKLRLPHRFVLGALAAMRLVGVLVEEWHTLGMARRARGGGATTGPFAGLRASLGQGLALLIQALRRASRLAVTMEAKGFGAGPRTWARPSAFTAVDVAVLAGGLAITAATVASAVLLGTWNSSLS